MRAVGIIAEYNPFHAGHALQLARARAMTGADAVIVAMSGAFTQRGEPALIDKWARARMALTAGADLVVELPCLFALREARGFAEGGVRLLSALGMVDALSFGCEPEGMALIDEVARCLSDEPEPYLALLRAGLARGLSYPRARAEAAAAYLRLDPDALNRPNFALALEYAQANARLARPLALLPVERTSDYHGLELGKVCSASAIRAAVDRGEVSAALEGVPAQCRAELARELGRRATPRLIDDLALIRLRGMSPAELSAYPGLGEGLESLICRQARRCPSAARHRRVQEQALHAFTIAAAAATGSVGHNARHAGGSSRARIHTRAGMPARRAGVAWRDKALRHAAIGQRRGAHVRKRRDVGAGNARYRSSGHVH